MLLLAIPGALFPAGNGEEGGGAATLLPTRQDLYATLYGERRALLVYGDGAPALSAAYREAARAWQAQSRYVTIEIRSASEVNEADLTDRTVYLIGTPAANRWIARLAPQLPLGLRGGSLELAGTVFRDSATVLSLLHPNPLGPRHPLFVHTAIDDQVLLARLGSDSRRLRRMPSDFQVSAGDRTLLMGFFDMAEQRRWQIDPERLRDFRAEERLLEGGVVNVVLHGIAPDAVDRAALTAERRRVLAEVAAFVGATGTPPLITYHIYGRAEDKGLQLGDTRLAHADSAAMAVHVVVEPGMRGDDGLAEAGLLLRHWLGAPREPALETGLAAWFSRGWHGRGVDYWGDRLFQSGNMPPLSEVLDAPLFRRESGLVMTAAAASFVAFALERYGREDLIRHYREFDPPPAEVVRLDAEWRAWLAARPPREAPSRSVDGYQKGFCHAHEGYQITNGYGSRESDAALARMRSLGSSSVSITPFSYMRDPQAPSFLPFSRRAGSETDEGVIHDIRTAQGLGMTVMLKPHLWLGRSWPGEIRMGSAADWEAFFGYYYRWMRHFALLGEMYGVDVLCVGVELVEATLERPDDWRKLVARLRPLFRGEITYAANWGREVEDGTWWDALDFLGANAYYPLAAGDSASDAALRRGAGAMMTTLTAVGERVGRPVVITEVGYTSTPEPWREPHRAAGGEPVDLEGQRRSYAAVLGALAAAPAIRGIYFWKWPTYLSYGGSEDNDFTPNGKPAEAVVRAGFARLP